MGSASGGEIGRVRRREGRAGEGEATTVIFSCLAVMTSHGEASGYVCGCSGRAVWSVRVADRTRRLVS